MTTPMPGTSSITSTWQHVRMQVLRPRPRLLDSKLWWAGVGASDVGLSPPGDSEGLENTAPHPPAAWRRPEPGDLHTSGFGTTSVTYMIWGKSLI